MTADRDLGVQPLLAVMAKHQLEPTDLVAASDEQLTHRMVARATKGRRLTPNAMAKVVKALNAAAASRYAQAELFNYTPKRGMTPGER
jgi:hypothetical protein